MTRREVRRRLEADRDAAFTVARNLAEEYRDPTQKGGHVHRTFLGHSLQAGEKVRRHVCCWFRSDTGSGWSSPRWSKVYVTDMRLFIHVSDGELASVWWRSPSLRFVADLTVGCVNLDNRRQAVHLSGTQIAVVAVACVYNLEPSQGLRHPALRELRR
jgi:hypothetical protein